MRAAARWALRGLVGAAGAAAGGTGVLAALLANQVHRARVRQFLPETLYERHLRFPGPADGVPLRVVVMGDSTSTGVGTRRVGQTYAAALGRRLARRGPVEVLVTGRAGARAADVLRDQLPAALDAQPDLVLLIVGANDVTHVTPTPALRHSIRQILDALTGIPTVVAGAPEFGIVPSIGQPLRGLASWRGHRVTAVIRGVARKRPGVRFVDLGRLTGPVFGADPAKAFAADQFHPSPDGYAFWTAVLGPAVEASDPRHALAGSFSDRLPAAPPRPAPAARPAAAQTPAPAPRRGWPRPPRIPRLLPGSAS